MTTQIAPASHPARGLRRPVNVVNPPVAPPPIGKVDWSPSYVAFLVYIFTIVTYRLPLGTASMIAALLFLPMERRGLHFPPPVLWAIAFLAWAFIGIGASPFPWDVWTQVQELAKACGVMIVAVNVLTTRARFRFFMLAFLGFFAFYPVRGAVFSYFIYHGTVEGRAAWNYAYSNPNDMAALCLVPLSFALGMLFRERTTWVRLCALAGAITLPFVILLTQSRGAFIALSVFALTVLKGQKKHRLRIVLIASAAAVVIALAAPSSVWKRLGTLQNVTSTQAAAKANDEGSARQRMEIWRVAWAIFTDHPVLGAGFGAYPDVHFTYSVSPAFDPIAVGHRDAHSTYMQLLAETGAIGFVLFFTIVGTGLTMAERTRRRIRTVDPTGALQLFYMEVGVLGFFVAGVWGSYAHLVVTYIYVAVLYVAAQLLRPAVPSRAWLAHLARARSAAQRAAGHVPVATQPGAY